MFAALKQMIMGAPEKAYAHALYAQIVEQARKPFLFTDFAIPDTLDGRFESVVLHLYLAQHRLMERPSPDVQLFCRALQEAFFADMDRSIREMGVGDTGVGKRVKNMASAFLGRVKVYTEASKSVANLTEALERNVYRGTEGMGVPARKLADYMIANTAALTHQNLDELMSGRISFLDA